MEGLDYLKSFEFDCQGLEPFFSFDFKDIAEQSSIG